MKHIPPAPKDTLPLRAAIIGGSLLAAGAAWLVTSGHRKSKKSKACEKACKAARKSGAYKSSTPPPLYTKRGGKLIEPGVKNSFTTLNSYTIS